MALLLVLAGAVPGGPKAAAADFPLEPSFHALPANFELLRLENGLEVVLMRNPAQPMVGIYTQVKVGSAREDQRTSGMSHMLEHLLFNGTRKWDQEALYAETDRLGAYNNANTTDFYTNFMTVLPAGDLAAGLELQSQMLFHSLIPADKFAKEQGIVLGEMVQARDWPGRALEVTLRHVLFAGSSLELPTLGTRASIANLQRDDVYDFYRAWYVPNNMVLTLAGNFERDEAVALLQEHYGAVAPGTVPAVPLVPLRPIEQTRSVTRRAGDQRTVALAFEAPVWGMADFYPFLVLTELLTLEGSGLLTRVLDSLDAAVRPEVGLWWEKAPGFGRLVVQFTLPAGVDPGQCYSLVQDAVGAGLELGVADEDLLGVVSLAETSTLLEREQLRMTGIYAAETLVQGGPDEFVGYLDHLRAVTGADVLRVLESWLLDVPCQAVLVEPAPDGAAAGDTAAGAAAAGPLPIDRAELANGAVLVSQTNPDGAVMAIHLAVRGRSMLDRDNATAGALDLVHRLLAEGYAGCDASCLARELRRLGAVVKKVDDGRIPMDDYYTNGRFSYIRIETAAQHGAEVLSLLTREIQHAAFDQDAFDRVRDERVTELQRNQASARATANRLLEQTLYADHPLALEPEGSAESPRGADLQPGAGAVPARLLPREPGVRGGGPAGARRAGADHRAEPGRTRAPGPGPAAPGADGGAGRGHRHRGRPAGGPAPGGGPGGRARRRGGPGPGRGGAQRPHRHGPARDPGPELQHRQRPGRARGPGRVRGLAQPAPGAPGRGADRPAPGRHRLRPGDRDPAGAGPHPQRLGGPADDAPPLVHGAGLPPGHGRAGRRPGRLPGGGAAAGDGQPGRPAAGRRPLPGRPAPGRGRGRLTLPATALAPDRVPWLSCRGPGRP